MTRHLGLCVVVALAGCAGATAAVPPRVATTSVVVTESAAPSAERPEPAEEPVRPVPTFRDEQIVALLATFDAGEVDLATLARARSRDPRVRAFAGVLADDHRAALRAELRLGAELPASPPDARARRMQRAAAAEAAKLASLDGHALDVEFLASQEAAQRDTLAMLDVELIPSARREDVRAHLAELRRHVDHHLRDATALARVVGGPSLARR